MGEEQQEHDGPKDAVKASVGSRGSIPQEPPEIAQNVTHGLSARRQAFSDAHIPHWSQVASRGANSHPHPRLYLLSGQENLWLRKL